MIDVLSMLFLARCRQGKQNEPSFPNFVNSAAANTSNVRPLEQSGGVSACRLSAFCARVSIGDHGTQNRASLKLIFRCRMHVMRLALWLSLFID